MERITTSATNLLYACLLFFFLFSACSKSSQVKNYNHEEEYARASWELEQGEIIKPGTSYIAPPMINQNLVHKDTAQEKVAITKQSLCAIKQEFKREKINEKIDLLKPLQENIPAIQPALEQRAVSTEPAVLKWVKLLAFLPLSLAVVLMHRIKTKGKQKEQDTLIIGGLVSVLLVILLIVLIIALI